MTAEIQIPNGLESPVELQCLSGVMRSGRVLQEGARRFPPFPSQDNTFQQLGPPGRHHRYPSLKAMKNASQDPSDTHRVLSVQNPPALPHCQAAFTSSCLHRNSGFQLSAGAFPAMCLSQKINNILCIN